MPGVWRRGGTFPRADGECVIRSESNRYDTVRQLVDSQHRYEEYGPDGTLTRTSLHRLQLAYLYPPDLRRLLNEAGFQSVQIAGGFDGRPFENDTDELVTRSQRRLETALTTPLRPPSGAAKCGRAVGAPQNSLHFRFPSSSGPRGGILTIVETLRVLAQRT